MFADGRIPLWLVGLIAGRRLCWFRIFYVEVNYQI